MRPTVDIGLAPLFPPGVEHAQQSGIAAADPATVASIAELCHLVRTPLNGILGTLELLIDSDLSDDSRELAEGAYDAATALHLLFEHNLPSELRT